MEGSFRGALSCDTAHACEPNHGEKIGNRTSSVSFYKRNELSNYAQSAIDVRFKIRFESSEVCPERTTKCQNSALLTNSAMS